jgi:photosystem II stability/assembly factor-like uncharacterized protein
MVNVGRRIRVVRDLVVAICLGVAGLAVLPIAVTSAAWDTVDSRGAGAPTAVGFWNSTTGLIGTGGNPHKQNHCPGTVLRTTDGGRTFRKILDTSGGVTWIDTAGTQDAWVQVDRCEETSVEHYPRPQLFHTANAGETWERLPKSRVWNPSFASQSAGFAFARRGGGLPWATTADGTRLFATVDAGTSWTEAPGPCDRFYETVLSAPTPDDLRAACVYAIGAGAEEVHVFASSNGGHTWRKRTGDLCPLSYYVGAMSFGSPDWGLIHADYASMCKTRDGGRTWRSVPSTSYPRWGHARGWRGRPAGIAAFQARPAHQAIMLLGYRHGIKLVSTDDAGRSWTVLHRWRFRPRHP